MAVEVGDRYRNTSGALLYGLMPPDCEAEVRQVDPKNEDTAHHGTLVLEYDPDPGGDNATEHKAAIGLTDDELGRDWAPVGGQQRGGGRRG
jgi:hypothetical protein